MEEQEEICLNDCSAQKSNNPSEDSPMQINLSNQNKMMNIKMNKIPIRKNNFFSSSTSSNNSSSITLLTAPQNEQDQQDLQANADIPMTTTLSKKQRKKNQLQKQFLKAKKPEMSPLRISDIIKEFTLMVDPPLLAQMKNKSSTQTSRKFSPNPNILVKIPNRGNSVSSYGREEFAHT